MARDATARLYDVDADRVVLKKLGRSERYDHGTIVFRAKQGRLIDLDKLHESIWATRLSGGTSSGLVKLEVTAVGEVLERDGQWILRVNGAGEYFVLGEDPETAGNDEPTPFRQLERAVAAGARVSSVTGRLDGWSGRWPAVLREKPPKPRRILVQSFELHEP